MAEEKPKLTWWQWFLMYPTLLIALAGSIPTIYQFYQSLKLQVSFKDVSVATYRDTTIDQHRDSCLPNLQFHPVPSGDKTSIFVGVCPHRALVVLVQPDDPKAQTIFRLIAWSDIANTPQTSLLVKEAAAEELSTSFKVAQGGGQEGPIIRCQKRVDNGRLLLRISYPNGKCFDQTVNTFTGVVISTVPVPCDQPC